MLKVVVGQKVSSKNKHQHLYLLRLSLSQFEIRSVMKSALRALSRPTESIGRLSQLHAPAQVSLQVMQKAAPGTTYNLIRVNINSMSCHCRKD